MKENEYVKDLSSRVITIVNKLRQYGDDILDKNFVEN